MTKTPHQRGLSLKIFGLFPLRTQTRKVLHMNTLAPYVKSEPYAITPSRIARDPSISPVTRCLYTIIDSHLGDKTTQKVSLSTLATELGRSTATVRRSIAELEAIGLVQTFQTGRSLILKRVNNSRNSCTSEHSDVAPVSTPKSNNKRVITTTGEHRSQETVSTTATTPVVADYLVEINKAAGTQVRNNKTVTAHIRKMSEQGLSPQDVAALASAYLAAHRSGVSNPAGFIVSFALPAIASGERPETPQVQQAPPMFMDLVTGQECEHGDPRGEQSCAICRHAKAKAAA
jgi:hypothetical protein